MKENVYMTEKVQMKYIMTEQVFCDQKGRGGTPKSAGKLSPKLMHSVTEVVQKARTGTL